MGRTGAYKYKGSNPMRNIAALQAAGVIIAPGAHCVGETIQKVLVTSI
jgi:hypothetical protein